MPNETVTYDLATVLARIEARLDKIESVQNSILLSVSELKEEIKQLETKVDGIDKRIENVETFMRIAFGGIVVTLVGGIFTFLNGQ